MSSSHSKKTIEKHHVQVDNSRLRKIKEQYEKDHAKQQYRREMKQLGIAWQVFKAVYIACLFLSLLSAMGWAIGEVYNVF